MTPLERAARRAVDRLPVGRDVVRRAAPYGRAILGALPRRADGALPAQFQVFPLPRTIRTPWPEPPAIEEPRASVAPAGTAPARSPEPVVFDIELFEALNEEYAARPLVPAPRGLDADASRDRARSRLASLHASLDLADKRVLEFGCAAGYEVWTMAHHFGADAVGIDVVERAAWQALRGPRARFVRADIATDRPFAENDFDRIVSFSVFEHVTHPHSTAAELFRVLRPGGLAWISANLYRGPMASHRYREVTFPWPHLLFTDDVFREFYRRRTGRPRAAAWVNRLSWADYESMFRRVGFRLRSLRFSQRPIDEPFYRRFESVLGRYPRWDLERDFFHVVLEKPRRRPALLRRLSGG